MSNNLLSAIHKRHVAWLTDKPLLDVSEFKLSPRPLSGRPKVQAEERALGFVVGTNPAVEKIRALMKDVENQGLNNNVLTMISGRKNRREPKMFEIVDGSIIGEIDP